MNLSNLDFGLLFLFKTCVESKSFSKASEILHVKQPAISYSMKKLENLLNVKLFDRGNFGIKLTEEGKILYDYVTLANNNILSGLNIVDELSKKEITEIKIGVSLNLALSNVSETIESFKKIFPNVIVSVFSKDEEIMLHDLQEKKLDIVIFSSSKNKLLPGVKIRRLKNNEIVFVGTKYYVDLINNANKKIEIPVITPLNNTILGKKTKDYVIDGNIKFKNSITCHSAIIAKELILSGLGVGYIGKEAIKKELDDGELFTLREETSVDTYVIELATLEKNLNIVIKQFIKIFKEKVSDK